MPAVCRAFAKSVTGNDTPALLLAQNKIHAKAVLAGSGLPVRTERWCLRGGDWSAALRRGDIFLSLLFVMPVRGLLQSRSFSCRTRAKRAVALVEKLHRQFTQPVIVEQFIPTRELNVSVFERGGKPRVMPLAEIDFSAFTDRAAAELLIMMPSGRRIRSAINNTPRKIPADLPKAVSDRVTSLAAAAFKALGCRDYARVDFRLDEKLNPFILEVNPNPDISLDAGFAAALAAGGIPYERFVWTVLDNARQRAGQ